MLELSHSARIAIILPDLAIIGAQRVALEFGSKLVERGYDVEWICGDTGAWAGELDQGKVRYFRPNVFSAVRGIRILEGFARLGKILARENYDVVLCVTPLLNRVACFLKLLGAVRGHLVIEDHAYPPRSYPDEFPRPIVRSFYRHTEWLYKYADIVRTLTADTQRYYQGHFPSINAVNFPNLMDLERIKRQSETPLVPQGVADILYVGRFTSQKNILYLIDCFSELVKKVDCNLAIIGYGPQEGLLKERVEQLQLGGRIRFLQSGPQNLALLRHAKVFPLVSLWEGFPLVLIEAMAVGTAVVSVDSKTGPRELLGGNSERGWLVPENDKAAFVSALQTALCDPLEREKRVAAASAYVGEYLDIGVRFEEYIQTFLIPRSEFR